MKIHFVDVETSGTSDNDDVLEAAVLVWDNGVRTTRYHKFFYSAGLVSPEAQKITGYDPMTWAKERDAQWLTADYVGQLADALVDAEVLAGFSIAFQRRMLYSMFRRTRLKWPPMGRAVIDVCGLAAPLVAAGKLPNLDPGTVAQAFGIDFTQGSAIAGANAAASLFERLTQLYWNGFK